MNHSLFTHAFISIRQHATCSDSIGYASSVLMKNLNQDLINELMAMHHFRICGISNENENKENFTHKLPLSDSFNFFYGEERRMRKLQERERERELETSRILDSSALYFFFQLLFRKFSSSFFKFAHKTLPRFSFFKIPTSSLISYTPI